MATQNNSRASDITTILMTGATGFTVRKRTGLGLFFHFFLLACVVILGASLLVYYNSLEGCILAVAIGLSFALVAQNLENLKKTKESIEFMNALFSSALSSGYKFCFIVKNTGDIVFYNRPFQNIFPAYVAQNTRTFESLLNLYSVSEADQNILNGFISSNSGGNISLALRENESTENQTLTFHIEPIGRPTGFFLIRGK